MDNPGYNSEAIIGMKAVKGIYPSGGLHSLWINSEDTIIVKDNMKVGNGIDFSKKFISERAASEK